MAKQHQILLTYIFKVMILQKIGSRWEAFQAFSSDILVVTHIEWDEYTFCFTDILDSGSTAPWN
ncbi:MAG: hypothetical protein OEW86_04150 [Nitrosopumilus sp.]|nr:hypothetical protein [Nitrosopumilus sp.]MDH3564685.1 hypothetical protein [Nitrosopumilus sp.]MDH5417167.1 hypothetical protein [Nitrosopumilus sp.]MDH5554046.1 hypothetical protein [Nitrosopumilus sp.]